MENLALKRDGLQLGRSETKQWKGGLALVIIDGNFMTGSGVSTSVSLHFEPTHVDGLPRRAEVLRVFDEPGEFKVGIGAGSYYFHASGPDDCPWSVKARAEEPPKPEKAPTLGQRVRALEGKKGRKR